jgi:hypothetical protein
MLGKRTGKNMRHSGRRREKHPAAHLVHVLALAAGIALVALLVVGSAFSGGRRASGETVVVPAGKKAFPRTVFTGKTQVTISGFVTGPPAHDAICEYDAFYAFAGPGCIVHPNPDLQVGPVGGAGQDLFTLLPGQKIPGPRADNTYTVTVQLTGKVFFWAWPYTTHPTWGRHTGAYTITIGGGGAPAGGKQGATKTLTEPGPGGSVTVSSPQPLPADCPGQSFRAPSSVQIRCDVDVTVSSSAGDLKGTTVVGEGERTKAQATGEAVAACWLIGPEALQLKSQIAQSFVEKLRDAFQSLSADSTLRLCILLVQFESRRITAGVRNPQAAERGCRTQRLALAFRTSGGHIASVRVAKNRLTATSVRYSCTASGGTVKVTVDGRVKGGLRNALGTKLDLGVVRAQTAPKRAAKLTVKFAW